MTTSTPFEIFVSQVIDVVRHKILSSANLGGEDKVLSNLINTLFVTLFTSFTVWFISNYKVVMVKLKLRFNLGIRKENLTAIYSYKNTTRSFSFKAISNEFLLPSFGKWFEKHVGETVGDRILFDPKNKQEMAYGKGFGLKNLSYNNHPVYFEDDDVIYYTGPALFDGSQNKNYNNVSLCCRKQETMMKFISIINENSNAIEISYLKIYDVSSGSQNAVDKINPLRVFDTLVFRDKPKVIKMFENFQENLKIPSVFLPKNLGILVHGAPGTGKTSFVKCAANYFNRDVRIINFQKTKTVKAFSDIIYNENYKTSIFVFEEFDELFKQISEKTVDDPTVMLKILETAKNEEERKATINMLQNPDDKIDSYNLLTILCGMVEQEGRIIIATTNNPDKIPKNILRPGRFDYNLKLDTFNKEEIEELLGLIYKDDALDVSEVKFPEGVWEPVRIINMSMIMTQKELIKALKDPESRLKYNVM
jgi:DNA replication protein DnaC